MRRSANLSLILMISLLSVLFILLVNSDDLIDNAGMGVISGRGFWDWIFRPGPPKPKPLIPDGCEPDCSGKECGPDGCGGSCGVCEDGFTCEDGTCESICGDLEWCGGYCSDCCPDCSGKECGPDGCGGSCGSCSHNYDCINGQCIKDSPSPGTCSAHKNQMDFCTLDTNNCNSGYSPSYGLPACSCSCVKSEQGGEYQPQGEPEVSVTEKSCEDSDGGKNYDKQGIVTITEKDLSEDYKEKCLTSNYLREYYCKENNTLGYENHYCGDEYSCEDGRCIRCEPNCVGKDCGSDGCGSTCGSCSASEYCVSGKCVCVPDCSGKECGPDGCGGNCGICASNYKCEEGICVKEEQKRLCVDSDGGMEYDVGGKVVLSSGKEYTDYCLIGRILKEYYCKEGNLRYTYHFCEGGCGDGACGSGTQVARFTITGHAVKDMNENRGFFERIFEAALVFFS